MIKKYYTIQRIGAWNNTITRGFLEGDISHIYSDFLHAYYWMMSQMKKKIINYNGEFPVWLWVDEPDTSSGHLNNNEQGVLLEISLSEDRVLLSDYFYWHNVLMDNPALKTDEEWELFDAGRYGISKEETWEKIFDNNYLKSDDYLNPVLQGVTGRVYMDKIRLIKKFIAKNEV